MSDRPAADLTLREMFIEAEHTLRELIEHLEQNFLPRNQELRSLSVPSRLDEVRDVTVRTAASTLLESQRFSDQLHRRLTELTRAINEQASAMVEGD